MTEGKKRTQARAADDESITLEEHMRVIGEAAHRTPRSAAPARTCGRAGQGGGRAHEEVGTAAGGVAAGGGASRDGGRGARVDGTRAPFEATVVTYMRTYHKRRGPGTRWNPL